MRSFAKKSDNRRDIYMALTQQVESQLRDAYAKRYESGEETQSSLAEKIGVNRSAINRRLSGRNNLTLKTIADLIWALGQSIRVEIFDPDEQPTNMPHIRSEHCGKIKWAGSDNIQLNSDAGMTPLVASRVSKTPELQFEYQ